MIRSLPFLCVAAIALVSCSQVAELLPAPTTTTVSAPIVPTAAPAPTDTLPTTPSALSVVLKLKVAEANSGNPKYDRDEWRHWTDEDGDCQDARQETLIAESTQPVVFTGDEQCRVQSGLWIGPYTGTVVTDPSDLDIDHMVPLANAHRSGGHSWSKARKSAFANSLAYPGHLIATTARANRAKGAKGPEEWRPPVTDYWCQYAVDWIEIKRSWDLTATVDEIVALREMAATCDINVFVQPTGAGQQAETITTIATLTPRPTEATQTFVDQDCTDFDDWEEAQEFFEAAGGPDEDPHRLDRDGDGTACGSLTGAPDSATPVATPETPSAEPTSTPTPAMTPATPTPITVPPTSTPSPFPSTPTPTSIPGGDQSGLRYDLSGPDRNCGDFNNWSEAQAFFLAAGGPDIDPHRLDRNSDGVACESLPGAP